MSKSKSGRREGSETRTVMTGGKPAPLQKSIYGSTPKERVGGNPSSLFGKKLPGCSPATDVIGAPRK
jgi:hypothetical protein